MPAMLPAVQYMPKQFHLLPHEDYFRQGSRKCRSTGAALLGNGRPNWGNDPSREKERNMRNEKKKRGKEEEKKKEGDDKIFLQIIK